jgi:Rha family phage regulatory protein
MIGEVPMTTSLAVAEHFGKEHFNVLRDIREIIAKADDPGFTGKNFVESTHMTGRGKPVPCYRLTELGFSLLAMGFSGEQAMRWKRAYAEAFMAMREHVLQREQAAQADIIDRANTLYNERNALLAENMSLRYARDRLQINNNHLGAQLQALAMEKFMADQILTDGYSSNAAMQALVEFKSLFAEWVADDYITRRKLQEEAEAAAAIKSRVDPRRAASHEMLVRLQFALNRNLNDACVAWAMLQLGALVETLMYPKYPGTEAINVESRSGVAVNRRQILRCIDEQLTMDALADALKRLAIMGIVQIEPPHPQTDRRRHYYRLSLSALLDRVVQTSSKNHWLNVTDGVRGNHRGIDVFLPLNSTGEIKKDFPVEASLQPRIAPTVLPIRLEIDVRATTGVQDNDNPDTGHTTVH